jgi:outer membrane receptor protein involved in Fe transport
VNTFSSKRTLASGISVAAVAAALCMATPAQAQSTSSIRGDHGTPGSTITAVDTVTGQKATTTVNADGTFVIPGLRPSTYRVEGAGEPQTIELPVGQVVTIDVAPAEAAPVAEGGKSIVVTGRRNRQEVRSATTGTSVSQVQIENLPQNDRNFLNFAALAPGVTVQQTGGPAQNNKRIQAGATSADNVNVYIDGTSHKNQVGFNGIAGQNFSQGNPFPQSAVQEFRVETQNYKAEYEQAGSAIITAVTKTGGQEFHGNAFVEFMPKAWFGRPFYDRPGNRSNRGFVCPDDPTELCHQPKPDFKRYQFGADVGGPIIPGKLHFYAAYEGNRQSNPAASFTIDPALVSRLNLDVTNTSTDFKQNLYFGKLSFFATDADTLHASVFIRNETDVRDFGGKELREHGRDLGTKTKNYQLEWNHRADNWLNELTIGYFDSATGTPRLTDAPDINLTTSSTNTSTEARFGGHFFQQNNQQKDWNLRNSFTYTGFDGHVIKAGIRLSKTKLIRLEEWFGLGSYNFDATTFTDFNTSVPYLAQISRSAVPAMNAKNTMVGLFAQDDWTIDDHWTVNYGLRWDYESNNFNQNYVTPPAIATALRNYVGWQAAGIDAEDYISDGNNRDHFYGAFQPRIGVSYDVYGNRDLIFFAGAGRYYDRNNFYLASLETLFGYFRSDTTVNFCNGATPGQGLPACSGPGGTPAAGQLIWTDAYRDPAALRAAIPAGIGGSVWVLNNDTPVPYTDQFNLGVRKRFGDWQTSLTFAHNRSHDGFIFVRGNRMPDGSYLPPPFGMQGIFDNFPPEGQLPGFSGRLNIGSSKGQSKYNAFYLQAEKPWTDESQWGTTLALTISKAKSNQARSYGEAEMFNAGEQDAYGWQRVYGLEDWRFVGTGIVGLPLGIRASTTVTLSSGPRYGSIAFPLYNEAGIYKPRGNIPFKQVDLRLAKIFTMPWGHEVTADFQIYNLFDFVNKTYSTWDSGPPNFNSTGTTGPARSFQAGLKYSF